MINAPFNFYNILDNDERVLWSLQPKPKYRITKERLFLLVFGLFFATFALFWILLASSASLLFGLFGLPFLAIGLGLSFGVIWFTKRNLRNTAYALTAKRIIIKKGVFNTKINAIHIADIEDIGLTVFNDGIGEITLKTGNQDTLRVVKVNNKLVSVYNEKLQEVPEAAQLVKLIKALQEKLKEQ